MAIYSKDGIQYTINTPYENAEAALTYVNDTFRANNVLDNLGNLIQFDRTESSVFYALLLGIATLDSDIQKAVFDIGNLHDIHTCNDASLDFLAEARMQPRQMGSGTIITLSITVAPSVSALTFNTDTYFSWFTVDKGLGKESIQLSPVQSFTITAGATKTARFKVGIGSEIIVGDYDIAPITTEDFEDGGVTFNFTHEEDRVKLMDVHSISLDRGSGVESYYSLRKRLILTRPESELSRAVSAVRSVKGVRSATILFNFNHLSSSLVKGLRTPPQEALIIAKWDGNPEAYTALWEAYTSNMAALTLYSEPNIGTVTTDSLVEGDTITQYDGLIADYLNIPIVGAAMTQTVFTDGSMLEAKYDEISTGIPSLQANTIVLGFKGTISDWIKLPVNTSITFEDQSSIQIYAVTSARPSEPYSKGINIAAYTGTLDSYISVPVNGITNFLDGSYVKKYLTSGNELKIIYHAVSGAEQDIFIDNVFQSAWTLPNDASWDGTGMISFDNGKIATALTPPAQVPFTSPDLTLIVNKVEGKYVFLNISYQLFTTEGQNDVPAFSNSWTLHDKTTFIDGRLLFNARKRITALSTAGVPPTDLFATVVRYGVGYYYDNAGVMDYKSIVAAGAVDFSPPWTVTEYAAEFLINSDHGIVSFRDGKTIMAIYYGGVKSTDLKAVVSEQADAWTYTDIASQLINGQNVNIRVHDAKNWMIRITVHTDEIAAYTDKSAIENKLLELNDTFQLGVQLYAKDFMAYISDLELNTKIVGLTLGSPNTLVADKVTLMPDLGYIPYIDPANIDYTYIMGIE